MLVNNWLKYIQARGLSNSAGLRELNQACDTQYKDNSLYLWRNGSVRPDPKIADYMRACVAKTVLSEVLAMEIQESQAITVSKELS